MKNEYLKFQFNLTDDTFDIAVVNFITELSLKHEELEQFSDTVTDTHTYDKKELYSFRDELFSLFNNNIFDVKERLMVQFLTSFFNELLD